MNLTGLVKCNMFDAGWLVTIIANNRVMKEHDFQVKTTLSCIIYTTCIQSKVVSVGKMELPT